MRPSRDTQTAAIGVAALLTTAGMLILAFSGFFASLTAPAARTVRVVFANTAQLRDGNPVLLDGIKVGTVQSITPNPGNGSSTVSMTVENSAGPLYGDATAKVLWRTVLGGAFSVYLTRGSPNARPLGNRVIPEANTLTQVELDDVTSILRGQSRLGFTRLPREFGELLRTPNVPADALKVLAAVAPSIAVGANAIRGQALDSDLEAMVVNTDRTVQALNTPMNSLRDVIAGAAATFQTTGNHAGDIDSTLAQASAAMAQTRQTLAALHTTLGIANGLLDRLYGPAVAVGPTLAQLRPTVIGLDVLARRAQPLLRDLRPAVTQLAGAGASGTRLLTALTPSLTKLHSTVLPYMAAVDPGTKHPTYEMIGPALDVLGPAAMAGRDANGHWFRFPATFSEGSVDSLPCRTFLTDPTAKQLVVCQSLGTVLQQLFSYRPSTTVPGTVPASRSSR